jgi:predicted molibdopterin-dependent oxidoreductase YjgC
LTWAEKIGTFTNHAGRVQQLQRAFAPLNGQPSDGEIFTRLLMQLSEGRWTFEPESVLEEIAATVRAYAGLSYAGVGPQGVALAEGREGVTS